MDEKHNIGSLFDRIAFRYDFLNHLFSLNIDRLWRKKAVGSIHRAGQDTTCLDVAIGTADLAIELLKQHKASHIIGIDLSEQMMLIGEQKAAKLHLNNQIEFRQASAQNMPFDDNSFDVVTCAFGVRNFADLNAGLSEMLRVLRPNGQLMILEFSYPQNKVIAWLYDFYFAHIMPLIGRLVSKDKNAYNYFYHSVRNFIWGKQMTDKLTNIGFRQATAKPYTFGIATAYTAYK